MSVSLYLYKHVILLDIFYTSTVIFVVTVHLIVSFGKVLSR